MRSLVLISLLLPSVVLAQPAGPQLPPSGPPPPDEPSQPQPPPEYPPQGAPVTAPAPYPQPAPYQPPYPAPKPSYRNGMTYELAAGIGGVRVTFEDEGEADGVFYSDPSLALALGIGGWINPKLALMVRAAGVTIFSNGTRATVMFIGPSAQSWINDHLWLGGGVGLAATYESSGGEDGEGGGTKGFGFDLRAGYTFSTGTDKTFNVSVELTPGFYDGVTITGVALLFGYQHL